MQNVSPNWFADFKLEKSKEQSQEFSCAVMENFDTEFIATLFNKEKTVEEVSLILRDITLIKGGSRLGPWNAIVQNVEYLRA